MHEVCTDSSFDDGVTENIEVLSMSPGLSLSSDADSEETVYNGPDVQASTSHGSTINYTRDHAQTISDSNNNNSINIKSNKNIISYQNMTSQYDGEKTRPTASVSVEEKHEWTCRWCGNIVVGKFIHKCMVCDHTYNSDPPMAVYCGQPYTVRAARATTAMISQMCWVCSCDHVNDMTYPDCTNCKAEGRILWRADCAHHSPSPTATGD